MHRVLVLPRVESLHAGPWALHACPWALHAGPWIVHAGPWYVPPFLGSDLAPPKFGDENMGTEGALKLLVMNSSTPRPPYCPHRYKHTCQVRRGKSVHQPEHPQFSVVRSVGDDCSSDILISKSPYTASQMAVKKSVTPRIHRRVTDRAFSGVGHASVLSNSPCGYGGFG